jgi:hypothetical protein
MAVVSVATEMIGAKSIDGNQQNIGPTGFDMLLAASCQTKEEGKKAPFPETVLESHTAPPCPMPDRSSIGRQAQAYPRRYRDRLIG